MIKKTSFVFALCLGALLINNEVKAQSQIKEDTAKMEQSKKTTKLQLNVEGMSCQAGCANGIDNMLKQQRGVIKSKTTYDTGTSVIWFNGEAISQKEIIDLIIDRGFEVKAKPDTKQ